MNLALPLNFGERPCDRLLLSELKVSRGDSGMNAVVLWMMFLVWRDFGIARDDRRKVPVDPVERASCASVMILESYCGWQGAPGGFVERAVAAGFFVLVPADEGLAELVLVDFFPANHSGARDVSSSKRGGVAKSVNLARKHAEAAAEDQLVFFERQSSPLLASHGKAALKEASFLIHQVCRILGFAVPVAAEWKDSLVNKAVAVMARHPQGDIDLAFKWFVANRGTQQIPKRIDFVLDQLEQFIDLGRKDFG